jgi:hypothetical protein
MMKNKTMRGSLLIAMVVIFKMASAQMPVEKESHHKITFENKLVRVLDLVIQPHDTTLVHVHSAASIVVFLSNSNLAIQTPKQAPVITPVKIGDVVYRTYDEKPATHIVWGADKSVFRCLVVELKPKSAGHCLGMDAPLLWEEIKAAANRLDLPDTKEHLIPRSSCPYVIVSLGTINVTSGTNNSILKEGDFVFVPDGNDVTIQSDAKSSLLLLQIK